MADEKLLSVYVEVDNDPYKRGLDEAVNLAAKAVDDIRAQLKQLDTAFKPFLDALSSNSIGGAFRAIADGATKASQATTAAASETKKAYEEINKASRAWQAELDSTGNKSAASFRVTTNAIKEARAELSKETKVELVTVAKDNVAAQLASLKTARQEASATLNAVMQNRTQANAAVVKAARENLASINAQISLSEKYYQFVERKEAELIQKKNSNQRRADVLAAQDAIEEIQAARKRDLEFIREEERTKTNLAKQAAQDLVSQSRWAGEEIQRVNHETLQDIINNHREQVKIWEKAKLTQIEFAKEARAAQLQAIKDGDTTSAGKHEVDYRERMAFADQAAEREIGARRRVRNAEEQQAQVAMNLMRERQRANKSMLDTMAADEIGYWGRMRRELQLAADAVKEVEKRYYGIVVAGAQVRSLGGQITAFGQDVIGLGRSLTENAGDFDFWARRIVASAQSAGSAMGADQLLSGFKELSFELSNEIGTDRFAEVAEAVYVYQSAVGRAINSTEDLAAAQSGLDTVMKAATISDANMAGTIRGVLQVMAEFGLGVNDMSRATMILQNVTQVTQSEFTDMIEAFKYVGPLAAKLGMDVEEVAAIFGKLSEFGLKGSTAGRGLAVMFEGLVAPTDKTDGALQQLLITNKGLAGSWKDILAPGGEFLSLLDRTNADGTKTAGVFSVLANSLKDYNQVDQMEFLNAIFGQNNALRNAIPLIFDQIDALNGVTNAASEGKAGVDDMVNSFKDSNVQADLFNKQWATIEDSIKVRGGRELSRFKENMMTIGMAVAEMALPIATKINDIIDKVMAWGNANQDVMRGIIKLVGGVGLLAATAGPALIAIGTIIQGFGTLPVVMTTLAKGSDLFGFSLKNIIPTIFSLTSPMTVLKTRTEGAAGAVNKFGFGFANLIKGVREGEGLMGKLNVVTGALGTGLGTAARGATTFLNPLNLVKTLLGGIVTIPLKAIASIGSIFFSLINPVNILGFAFKALALMFGGAFIGSLTKNEQLMGAFRQTMEALKPAAQQVQAVMENLAKFFSAIFSGDSEKAKEAFANFVESLKDLGDTVGPALKIALEAAGPAITEALRAAISFAAQVAPELAQTLIYELASALAPEFVALNPNMETWGWNLVASLAQGMWDGAVALVGQVTLWIAEQISRPFRSYSPPRYGPLMGIYQWGKNLIGTFLEGANAADVDAIYEVTDRIAEAMTSSFENGWGSGAWLEGMQRAHELTNEMLDIVRDGGTVNEDFFAGLKGYLGEWYNEIVQINLAYQQVYGLERSLAIEKQRLDVLKAQRDVLQKQLDLRLSGFESAVDPTGGDYYKPYEGQMVDPTTEAGQKQIEQMRSVLSKEDFQSWISFQKKLWESRHKEEDSVYKVQQQQIEAAVAAQELQLSLVKAQYENYVAMYEYALKLSELGNSDPTKNSGGGGGGGANANDDATNADLEEARRRVRKIAGEDQALKDEITLGNELGGPIQGIGGADSQRDREAERIKDLDAENRKRQAEFDVRKIQNAGNKEQLEALKREEEAWNAAYREEKARLQERKGYSEEVLDAAGEVADKTKPGRVEEQRAEFEKEIRDSIGEQKGNLESAEELKQRTGSLDAAAVESQKQLRDEERELADLRQVNDKKRLDFEEKILAAAGDEERLRIIKEEQEAWELAYKKALEAQEERTNAARRADQDLNDEQQAGRSAGGGGAEKRNSLPGAPSGLGGGGVGSADDPFRIELNTDGPIETDDVNLRDGLPGVDRPGDKKAEDPMSYAERERIRQERARAGGDSLVGSPGEKTDLINLGGTYAWQRLLGAIPGVTTDADRLDTRYENAVQKQKDRMNGGTGVRADQNVEGNGFWGDLNNFMGDLVTSGGEIWRGIGGSARPGNGDSTGGWGVGQTRGASIENGIDPKVWETTLRDINTYSDETARSVAAKLNGPEGPFASTDFALGKVNGLWQQVLIDSEGNPTNITKTALDAVTGSFYSSFTGDGSPQTLVDDAFTKMGISAYAKLTGDKSPPATMAEMVSNLGIESYKLLTGANNPPSTIAEMNNQIGSKMYELLTGEKAPAKITGEFTGEMLKIFETLGIEGPIPNTVEGGMQLIAEKILKDMSPNGTVPTNVKSALDIMGADFLTKFSPNGEMPKNMEEAMKILGKSVAGAMKGPGSITDVTESALLAVKGGYTKLKDDPDGIPALTSATGEQAKANMRRQFLEDGGLTSISEDATGHVTDTFRKLKEGEGNIVGVTDETLGFVRLAFSKLASGEEGQPKSTMALFISDLQTKFREGFFGEGGVQPTFIAMADAMVTKATTVFGSGGLVATLFDQAATAAGNAARNAVNAAVNAGSGGANSSPGGGGQQKPIGSYASGIDLLPGNAGTGMLIEAHGGEAVLSHTKGDANFYRLLKKSSLWDVMKAGPQAAIEKVKAALATNNEAKASIGRETSPTRTIQPTQRRQLIADNTPTRQTQPNGKPTQITNNWNIQEINTDNTDELNFTLNRMSRMGGL